MLKDGFAYNVFDRDGRIKVSYQANETDGRYPDAWNPAQTGNYDDRRLKHFIEINHADFAGPIDVSSRGCLRIECDDAFQSKILESDRLVFCGHYIYWFSAAFRIWIKSKSNW